MKDIIKIIIVGAIIIFVAALFLDTEDKKTAAQYPTPIAGPAPVAPSDVSAFEEGYMEGCMEDSDGTSTFWGTYCQCTYDYIDARKTPDQFFDLAVKYSKDSIEPQIMTDAVESCLN